MGNKVTRHTLTPNDFVHLHNHTEYSLLDGLTKIPKLMEKVKTSGMSAVAITDHGTLSGAIEFYKEALNDDIKPIIGIETYIAERKHTDKDPSKDKKRYHLIVLSMNEVGYQNLMKLSTIANLDGFYYYPRICRELLKEHSEGLIVLSGCMGSELGDALKQGQYKQAVEIAKWYKSVFKDRYYLEVQDHGHPKNPMHNQEQEDINNQVLQISKELNIPAVVTNDAHYLYHEDQEAHEILLCVGTGSFMSDDKRMSLKDFPLHVETPDKIIDRWGESNPELILNTKRIADRCELKLNLGEILIPKFPTPKNQTEKSYLQDLVYRGLAQRYSSLSAKEIAKKTKKELIKSLPSDVADRAAFELKVIDDMGFNGYFLIISDFINWGKEQGIVFGPGRGSAAGSIIAYALNITELDPLEYDLLFERFLNPDRISMPDIDIDIQDSRRDEVIKYCVDKYGEDRVANIVTFGRMYARNAVRDVARVLQVPYAEADRLAKMIPPPVQGRHIPLSVSIKKDDSLRQEYASNETSKMVLDQAVKLEGTIRSHGVHAAGVVIAPDDIVKFTPLEMAQKGVVSTQYSMGPVEDLGLLKMDFLGLSNLTIIKNTLRIVKKVYGIDIEISKLPLNDKKTFNLFQRGDTTGVFQLESAGMKRYLKELKPTVFEDIVAMVALYRPGPMQFIDDFIGRKHGLKKIEYPHPAMENSLSNTYGVLVYQEQVMQISKEVCGFSGGEADTLRKAIGKKNAQLMAKMKDKMIEGGQKHSGIDKSLMETFWSQLEEFAAYCFNKSHAACYGLIAYQTAYLKAHYPSAFMAALMTSDYDDIDRLAIEINECKNMGIEVLPPDVNESFVEFAVVPETNQIRFGMAAIKNVGTAAVEEILRAREEGEFKSLEDYLRRVSCRIVNKKAQESLIKSGALDRFGDRSTLFYNVENLVAYASRTQKDALSGQTGLFGDEADSSGLQSELKLIPPDTEHQINDLLAWERELLGLYLSSNPLEVYLKLLEEKAYPINQISSSHDGKKVTVGGIIEDVREISTKNGKKMAFVKIADAHHEVELVLFPSIYQETTGIWQRDRVVLAKGKISSKDKDGNLVDEIKILVEDAREITYEQAASYQSTGKKHKELKTTNKKVISANATVASAVTVKRLYIRISSSEDQDMLIRLKEHIDQNVGKTEVVLVIGETSNKQVIKLPVRLEESESCLSQIRSIVGEKNVILS